MRVAELLMRLMMLTGVLLLEATYTAAQPSDVGVKHRGCQERCGNVSIPYPFGTTKGCYLDYVFLITCNNSFDPPKAFIREGNVEVTNISFEGKLRITQYIAIDCYDKSGANVNDFRPYLNVPRLTISDTDNKFIVVGCDTFASIMGFKGNKVYRTGCMSICSNIDYVTNNSCSGIGCCQTPIPKGMDYFNITVRSFNSHKDVWDFNPCSYAFVVEESSYSFSSRDLSTHHLQDVKKLPTVLDWSIGSDTCKGLREKNMETACKGNSTCDDPNNGSGYRCKCNKGYRGNPYLGCLDIDECKDAKLNKCMNNTICNNTEGNYTCTCPFGFHGDGRKGGDGCLDINECEDSNLNKCVHNTTCNNKYGSYTCSCPKGYHGDGRKDGNRCISILLKAIEITGICVATMVLLMGISWFYMRHKKRKLTILKQKFFDQNKKKFFDQKGGSKIFQQLKSGQERTTETTNIFTVEELEKATKSYDESRIVGKGGYGTFYKGDLTDGRTVTIKKSERVHVDQIEQVINEIIVLSQISHENVVKLLGCCLETEVPLLVYEFITNGTLFDHIHKSKASTIAWKFRLKIAVETAGVLSYLHSLDKDPIIHRDVKSANILLDNSFTAKVYHFGASRLAPVDHAELSTVVQGTLGYLDPEYLQTSQLTDKSDVYSFGVILVELLTGKMALSFDKTENESSLSMYFLLAMKDGRLKEILDHCVVDKMTVCNEVANIAKRCLEMQGEKRPSMKEVAEDLVKLSETS